MQGSERLYQAAQTDDKQIELLEGYQHIILRQGDDEVRHYPAATADFARRTIAIGNARST